MGAQDFGTWVLEDSAKGLGYQPCVVVPEIPVFPQASHVSSYHGGLCCKQLLVARLGKHTSTALRAIVGAQDGWL